MDEFVETVEEELEGNKKRPLAWLLGIEAAKLGGRRFKRRRYVDTMFS